MKNANKRPYWSQNANDDRPTLTEAIVHLVVSSLLFALLFSLFACNTSNIKSMRTYHLPGGQRMEAHAHTVFIFDDKNKRLFSLYLDKPTLFVTDSTINNK